MLRSFPSAIACQGPGCWCWSCAGLQNTTKSSWVSTFACSSRRTCDHRKGWRCDTSSSFRQSKNFWSREQVVTTHPSERAGAAWPNRRVRHQRLTGPGTPTVPVSRPAVAQKHTRRRTALFSHLVHASDKEMGYALKQLRFQQCGRVFFFRYRLMLEFFTCWFFALAVVVFVSHSLWHAIMSFSAMSFYSRSLHLHRTTTSAWKQFQKQ